jgi:hypothetical protein
MYVINVNLRGKVISSIFMTRLAEVQDYALGWSKNKHIYLGYKVPFNDFNIFVYDVRKPCKSYHIEKPKYIYF